MSKGCATIFGFLYFFQQFFKELDENLISLTAFTILLVDTGADIFLNISVSVNLEQMIWNIRFFKKLYFSCKSFHNRSASISSDHSQNVSHWHYMKGSILRWDFSLCFRKQYKYEETSIFDQKWIFSSAAKRKYKSRQLRAIVISYNNYCENSGKQCKVVTTPTKKPKFGTQKLNVHNIDAFRLRSKLWMQNAW